MDVNIDVVHTLKDSDVILEYTGGSILAKDVNEMIKPQLEQMRQQILNSYVKAAEELLAQRMSDKLNKGDLTVNDTELQNYMKANNIPKTESEKIKVFLAKEKQRIGKQMSYIQLAKELNVKNHIGAIRYDLQTTAGMPQIGKTTASVTVQVFCDFGNPICNRSRLAMTQLKNELGDKVRWVYRHFPVASSAIGTEAALVSICALKQDKFWPVHDRFFDQQAALKSDNLVKEAVAVGLNEETLKTCLQSESTKTELDSDIKSAQMLGISSTPVYFVNGVRTTDVDQLFAEAKQQSQTSTVK